MPVGESWRNVGRKIRYLRKRHQLTIKQLAAGCGLSPNAISLLERGEVAPTVATLCKIASALGAPAGSFFQEICPNEVVLTRARGHRATARKQLAGRAVRAMECAITPQKELPLPEPADLVEDDHTALPVCADEFVLCLSGQIEYEADGQSYLLEPGDSLSFNGEVLHCWRNRSSGTAVAVMVLCAEAGPDEVTGT